MILFIISANMDTNFNLSRRIYHGVFKRNGEARTSLLFGHIEDYILVTIDWLRNGKNGSFRLNANMKAQYKSLQII